MGRISHVWDRGVLSRLSLSIVCPDTNFLLTHLHPYKEGIGGGKTAISLLTYYLSKYFKSVIFVGNVESKKVDNITYINLNEVNSIKSDILLATTSSDLDFSYLLKIKLYSRLKFAWLHNYLWIKGFDKINWDAIISCSHFVKTRFESIYGYKNVVTIHNGTPWSKKGRLMGTFVRRNPYGVMFASVPSKGLENTINIISILRKTFNKPFVLGVYGGYSLWGMQKELDFGEKKYIKFYGNKNLHELTKEFYRYSYMVGIYDFEEPFGMIYTQAMRAGIINILSNVGGINEYIKSGVNGFLIDQTSMNNNAVESILTIFKKLINDKEYKRKISDNAKKNFRSWDCAARNFCSFFYQFF